LLPSQRPRVTLITAQAIDLTANTMPVDQPSQRPYADLSGGGETLSWRPLRLLCIYRLVAVVVVLAGFAAGQALTEAPSMRAPALFFYTASMYLGMGFVCLGMALRRRPRFVVHVFVGTVIDIGALTILIHSAGGIAVGLGVLILVAVAAGSMLTGARLGSFFAALATIALLAEQSFSVYTGVGSTAGFTPAAFIGLGIFATALAGAYLARRARENEALAEKRGIDVENLEALNAHIVQRLETGVLAIDGDGIIRLANSTARELLGPVRPGMGQHLKKLAPDLARTYDNWCQAQQPNQEALSDAGGAAEFLPQFQPLGPGGTNGTLIFLENQTQMRARVQEAKLASLGRLTASIAHEIRNPLGAMLQAAQLLDEADYLADGERRLAAIISKQGRRMNETVENVLQLSRRAPPQRQPIELASWLGGFIEEWQDTHGNEGLGVSVDTEETQALFDPTHLGQIVDNLLRNVLQHGGRAENAAQANIRAQIQYDGRARLEVADNGLGIDPVLQEHLFEPFATSSRSGTGLGLYLARELCEANQARISLVAGRPGEGTCFRIVFARLTNEEAET